MMRGNVARGICAALAGVCGACGGTDALDETPWEPDTVTVVQPGARPTVSDLPDGDDCLEVYGADGDVCVKPQESCEAGSAADVVVDEDGNLLDVVCFPPEVEVVTPEEVLDGELPQNANNTAVVFGDDVFEGDLDVDANNVVLYGDDPAEATLEGDLAIDGNNAIVRGLTVDGNVTVTKNNATFVNCRILGDLTITFNNALISGCDIFGDVTIRGNNAMLNGNRLGGELSVEGRNVDCKGEANVRFDDANEDFVIDDDELGEEVSCGR